MSWFSDRERKLLGYAETLPFKSPVPTRFISNGEYTPGPQTDQQRQVESLLKDYADDFGKRAGMDRRRFLQTSSGMAAAFLAMNAVYGDVFAVGKNEASNLDRANERAKSYADQFIIDAQLHFVRDDFKEEEILFFLRNPLKFNWNPKLMKDIGSTMERYKFENFIKEIYLDSDTKIGVLSGAGSDDPNWIILTNDQMAGARTVVNQVAGSKRLLSHSWFEPGRPGWMDSVDYAIEKLKPDSWKGYTIGDVRRPAQFPWRMDDEKLVYPFYEKIQKAGIKTVCVHKGLLPDDYMTIYKDSWWCAAVDDVGKAAKDWPGLNFVIYHAGLRAMFQGSGYSSVGTPGEPDGGAAAAAKEFERTGYIQWSSDLAAIPQKFGVSNVYAEIGASFGQNCISNPRFAAAFVGTLVKGMGADHVIWGTDAVWAGSPQWQIEALRRIEIPEDYQKRFGFAPLGAPDGPVKSAIFGLNSARMYGLDPNAVRVPISKDNLKEMRQRYEATGTARSNTAYGYIHQPPV